MRKEIEKRPQIEGLVISPKTAELFARLGEIRETTNGVVKEKLTLKPFYDTINQMAEDMGFVGFFRVTIQSNTNNSWEMFSGINTSFRELLIMGKEQFDPTEGRRGSTLSYLYRDTNAQHDAFCRPGGGDKGQDNVTSIEYNTVHDNNHRARIVLTLGENYEMTEDESRISLYRDKDQGGERRIQLLQDCLRTSFDKINTAMEQVDRVRPFLQAPADVWKKVFGATA